MQRGNPFWRDVGWSSVVNAGLLEAFKAGSGIRGRIFHAHVLQDLYHQIRSRTVHRANGRGWSGIPCISCDLFCRRRRSAGSLPSRARSSLSRSLSFRDGKSRHHRRGARCRADAAPFKKPRRFTDVFLDLAMCLSSRLPAKLPVMSWENNDCSIFKKIWAVKELFVEGGHHHRDTEEHREGTPMCLSVSSVSLW